MSNYHPGGMMGSGIYATAGTIYFTCEASLTESLLEAARKLGAQSGLAETMRNLAERDLECDFDGDAEVIWNDWGTAGIATCPRCGTEQEVDAPDPNDEEPPDYDR